MTFACYSDKSDEALYMYGDFAESQAPQKNESEQKDFDNKESDRKIIKYGDVEFQTVDVEKTGALIRQVAGELEGYIATESAHTYSSRLTHRLVVRIPADRFDLFLEKLSKSIEKLDSKNINTLDITEEYIDVTARINAKKELRQRYTELLRRATTVSEILNIERELGALQAEIESAEGRMRYLTDRVAFATLNVTFYEKTASSESGFLSRLGEAFRKGWGVFSSFLIAVSYLWVFIAIAGIMVVVIRVWKRKKRTS
jgi:hypothetical protein